MPQRVTIKINRAAFDELRRSPALVDLLQQHGNRIAAAANAAAGADDAFEVDTVINPSRAVVFVRTATQEGRRAEATDRALTRAVL